MFNKGFKEHETSSAHKDRDSHEKGTVFVKTAPLLISGKKWASLVIYYDRSSVLEKINSLKKTIIIKALIAFFAITILIFGTGRIIARSYKKQSEESLLLSPIPTDAFTSPDLDHNTVLSRNNEVNFAHQKFTLEEKEIIALVSSPKTVREILNESSLDELLTFEIIADLVTKNILSIVKEQEENVVFSQHEV